MARLDFANARLGARRARLTAAATLRELLARPSLDARLELVRDLPLGARAAAGGVDPIATVERALREALQREGLALLEDAEDRRVRALLTAYLALDEAAAVKAVLRGAAQGAAIDRTLAAAPPVPGLDEEGLRFAAAASSLEGAVDALVAAGSELAAALREPLSQSESGREGLLPLELAVDRAAHARAASACRGRGEDAAVLRAHLADLADARNAATLLALAGAAPASSPWVPSGRRWSEAALDALARAGPVAARAAIAEGFPGTATALEHPWAADRALERACVAALRREARARPHSIAVPLAYLACRREEIRRVALVLRGAELALPGDELLELVEA